MKHWLKNNQKKVLTFVAGAVVLSCLVLPMAGASAQTAGTTPATQEAGTGSQIAAGITKVALGAVLFPYTEILAATGVLFATLMTFFLFLLRIVAEYSNFINADGVVQSWVFIRDLCNNFFIVFLLVIAVATILRVETYNYKRLLGKVLLMAILINFSKMFTGLLIDASQVVMLTLLGNAQQLTNTIAIKVGVLAFFNVGYMAIANVALGNGVEDFIKAATAAIFSVIACVVILIFFIILLARIIAFWFLIVLSPFAYFASAFPALQTYSGQWWSTFTKYLVVGPAIALFLFISMNFLNAMIGPSGSDSTGSVTAGSLKDEISSKFKVVGGIVSGTGEGVGDFLNTSTEQIFVSILTIGLLIAALIAAGKAGTVGSQLANKAMGEIQKKGTKIAKNFGEKTRVPAAARASYNRFANSRIGGVLGFNEKKTERDNRLIQAQMNQKFGGKADAIEKFRQEEQMAARDSLQKSGFDFTNTNAAHEILKKNKDVGTARALITSLAEAGDSELGESLQKYQKQFNIPEADFKTFAYDMERLATRKNAGLVGVSGYKNEDGQLVGTEVGANSVRNTVANMSEKDLSNIVITNSSLGMKGANVSQQIMGIADYIKAGGNLGFAGAAGRRQIMEAVKNMLAKPELFAKEGFDLNNKNTIDDLNKVINMATVAYSGSNIDYEAMNLPKGDVKGLLDSPDRKYIEGFDPNTGIKFISTAEDLAGNKLSDEVVKRREEIESTDLKTRANKEKYYVAADAEVVKNEEMFVKELKVANWDDRLQELQVLKEQAAKFNYDKLKPGEEIQAYGINEKIKNLAEELRVSMESVASSKGDAKTDILRPDRKEKYSFADYLKEKSVVYKDLENISKATDKQASALGDTLSDNKDTKEKAIKEAKNNQKAIDDSFTVVNRPLERIRYEEENKKSGVRKIANTGASVLKYDRAAYMLFGDLRKKIDEYYSGKEEQKRRETVTDRDSKLIKTAAAVAGQMVHPILQDKINQAFLPKLDRSIISFSEGIRRLSSLPLNMKNFDKDVKVLNKTVHSLQNRIKALNKVSKKSGDVGQKQKLDRASSELKNFMAGVEQKKMFGSQEEIDDIVNELSGLIKYYK